MVPLIDAEALEVVRLLRSAGERVLVSNQLHGATWDGLEPRIREEVMQALSDDWDAVSFRFCAAAGIAVPQCRSGSSASVSRDSGSNCSHKPWN